MVTLIFIKEKRKKSWQRFSNYQFREFQKINYPISGLDYDVPSPCPPAVKAIDYFFNWKSLIVTCIALLVVAVIQSQTAHILKAANELENLDWQINQTNRAIAIVSQQSKIVAKSEQQLDFSHLPNLAQPGKFTWRKQTLLLNDSYRKNKLLADIYLPHVEHPAPVIVISYGLNGKLIDFVYLAEQLASYGFAVAIPQNNSSNVGKLKFILDAFIYGTENNKETEPQEFINRILNVKLVLDELQRRSLSDPAYKVNVQQAGVIGHSLGGYTALALAGATLNFSQLQKDCTKVVTHELISSLSNMSLLLQCRALKLPHQLYNLQDKRIKAVMVMNPVSNSIFGQTGISKIQTPVMFMSSSNDILTPAYTEHILPFTWLNTKEKYLVTVQGSSHFSVAGKTDLSTNQSLALPYRYANVLSVAFFQTHVAGAKKYQPFLSASYAQVMSQAPMQVSLVNSLTQKQLEAVNQSAIAISANSLTFIAQTQNKFPLLISTVYANIQELLEK